ncbi:MAG TPA: TVP38/TMEM64 family protein [Thermoanaerobaculia bacterium]|nr:TVP38/TMEM64 family protein [Thermoanaerobaculia bacterium]
MRKQTLLRIAVLLLLVAAVAALWFTPLRGYFTRDNVRMAVEHFRGAWYGPLIFIAAYAVGCIFAIPATVFVVSAGFIWGWLLGGTYSMIGGVLGATASFLVGRYLGEGLLLRFGRLGQRVAKQVDHAGFKSLLVLRLIPIFPFAVLNYGAGVAGVRLLDYVFATALGLAPSNFVFAYCADALFNGTMSEGDALKRLFTVAALMLTIVLVPMALKKFVRRDVASE